MYSLEVLFLAQICYCAADYILQIIHLYLLKSVPVVVGY
jgi:hypothetical protein